MVVDALDECETDDDIRVILELLPKLQELSLLRVRLFLTSRAESPIRLGFLNKANHVYQVLALHEIPEAVTSHDITLFLNERFKEIRERKHVPTDWPGETGIRFLVRISVSLFCVRGNNLPICGIEIGSFRGTCRPCEGSSKVFHENGQDIPSGAGAAARWTGAR